MRVVADYEKDEVTITLSGTEANDVLNALTVAVGVFKRGKAPVDAAMADRYLALLERLSMLQADLWTELCEVDPSELN